MKAKEMVREAQSVLNENDIFADVYQNKDSIICVEIRWGDWKHEHMRADMLLMDKLGLECVAKKVTEENGSDCYSAIHYYSKSLVRR